MIILESVHFGASVHCPRRRVVTGLNAAEQFALTFNPEQGLLSATDMREGGATRLYPVTNIKEMTPMSAEKAVEIESKRPYNRKKAAAVAQ